MGGVTYSAQYTTDSKRNFRKILPRRRTKVSAEMNKLFGEKF
jgi:hypothetical protein